MKNLPLLMLSMVFLPSCDSTSPAVESPVEQRLTQTWSQSFELNLASSFQPTTIGDSLVVFANRDALSVFRVRDGAVKWHSPPLKNDIQLQSPEILFDNHHIYGGHLFELHAWDLETGSLAWSFTPDRDEHYYNIGYPAQDEQYFYGSSNGGRFRVIDKQTGTIVHEHLVGHVPRGITRHEDDIYLFQMWPDDTVDKIKGQVMRIEPLSGDTSWTFQTDQGGFWRNRPLVESGVVYAGSLGNDTSGSAFFALDANTGELVWKQPNVHTFTWTHGPRYLYINDSRDLVALDKSDGSIVWRTPLQAGSGEAHVAYMDGYVYHPHGAALFVLDGETGEIVHAEVPEDGTYYWQVGVGAGKVFTWTSRHFLALEPYQPQ